MGIFFAWLGLSFLVAFAGSNKKIGYGGTFFLSLILSPLIGLIIALVSAEKGKVTQPIVIKTEEKKSSTAEEIQKLKQLKDEGVLTEKEFNEQKAKLLA